MEKTWEILITLTGSYQDKHREKKNKALLLLLQENKADLKLKIKEVEVTWCICLDVPQQEVILRHFIAPPQLDLFWTPKMEKLWIRPVGD